MPFPLFRGVTALLAALLCAPAGAQPGETPPSPKPFTERLMGRVDRPRAMTFLPDGRFLVTGHVGTLWLFSADAKTRVAVAGVPAVAQARHGGLRDVALHPQFASNRTIYLTAAQGDREMGLVLIRAQLADDGVAPRLEQVETIFRASPLLTGDYHFSGRIAFSPGGKHLFLTVGERHRGGPAQRPDVTLGKVLRLNPDGTPAPNNPLAAKGFDPAIWSYGHRNLYGLAFDADGNLWEHEMGPMGGDEVNLIRAGGNYGWPLASNGSNYDGSDIPDHAPGDGFVAPKVWWNPSISPGGMIVYKGRMFPEWWGDLLIGALTARSLVRVDVEGTRARKAERWEMGARVREVEEAADGAVWLLYDDGRIVRIYRR